MKIKRNKHKVILIIIFIASVCRIKPDGIEYLEEAEKIKDALPTLKDW